MARFARRLITGLEHLIVIIIIIIVIIIEIIIVNKRDCHAKYKKIKKEMGVPELGASEEGVCCFLLSLKCDPKFKHELFVRIDT